MSSTETATISEYDADGGTAPLNQTGVIDTALGVGNKKFAFRDVALNWLRDRQSGVTKLRADNLHRAETFYEKNHTFAIDQSIRLTRRSQLLVDNLFDIAAAMVFQYSIMVFKRLVAKQFRGPS